MSAFLFLAILIGYVLILVAVSYWKGGDGSNDTFLPENANRPGH
jgi:hypothetical protein